MDTSTLIKFKFGEFQQIKDLGQKNQSDLYFATNKPALYSAGVWYGVTSLKGRVNEDTGEVTITVNGDFGDEYEKSQVECKFVAGMTTQQKADLTKAVSFVNTFEDPNIDNTKDVIDKWNEIVAFLKGFKDTDVLLDRISNIETNVTKLQNHLQNTSIIAGDGLRGGGDLSGNRTIGLGEPSTITDSSTNSVTTDSHTHAIDEASTEQRGIVRLNDTLTSESTDQALTARQGKVLNTNVKSITDLVNDMFSLVNADGTTYIKTKYGFASDKFVSAGGTDDTESGGSGGANLTQMWESLQNNNDTFANIKINKAHIPTLDTSHIPTLTTAKISDYVSATQAIADTAVANKADKATTLAGYGITDAVDLTSTQTISGAKTFANLKVSNSTLVTNLNADMVDGYNETSFIRGKANATADINTNIFSSARPFIWRLGYNKQTNYPTLNDLGYGNILQVSVNGQDTAFQLYGSGDYTKEPVLLFRSGTWKDNGSGTLYTHAWKQLAFTDQLDNYLPLTGGTLTGALTVNAPINNTGALKLLGASEVSSTSMAVGTGAKALGTQSRALASNSYAGLRTGDSTYPYASIKPYDLQPFTVNGNIVYGVPIPIGETVKYTYNNVEYSAENTTSTTQVLVLITAGADFKGGVVKPYNKCALTYSGASLSYGRRISGIKDLSGNVKAVIIYTWVGSSDESGFISSFKISNSDKLYAFRGDTSSSGEAAIAIGENSVANGKYSVVSGPESVASGTYSMASGYYSVASGSYSMAIGAHAIASGHYSVASGYESIARGNYSAASGYRSVASGNHSKAFGQKAIADGSGAMAFGELSQAKANLSFVFAYSGISARVSQTVLGRYNEEDVNSLLVIGSGTSNTARKNVFTVDSNGYVRMGNRLHIGVGGQNELYLRSDVADQLYVHTSKGVPFLIERDSIRRGVSTPNATLGTDQYKWFNVFTESLKIADANLTYDIGTLTVDKALKITSTLTAPQGVFSNYIKIGNATISWNPKGYLVIDEGLASHKFISAGGVVTGDAGGGGGGLSLTDMWISLNGNIDAYGKSKIHIDHIPLDVILSHDSYETDVANRINTFNYSNSTSFTSAVKALIVAGNIPTLDMSKINGLEDTLGNIGTVVQNNYETLSNLITNNHNDHEARIKALEDALTWQTV